MQRSFSMRLVLLVLAAHLFLYPQPAKAKYYGADPAKPCQPRACACSSACPAPPGKARSNTNGSISFSEGNLVETLYISGISGPPAAAISLTLTYNSYNADGSRSQLDTIMGYGWTHSFNNFLFNELGAMFRYDGDGRITRYGLNSSGGGYIAQGGAFETLVKNPDGSFTLTQKDQTSYHYGTVPGAPFLVGGPVWMLTGITDRNGNTTTLTYAGGLLAAITNSYGRSLTLAYNGQSHLSSVTDPAGRTSTFQYDATGHLLTSITDNTGKSVQYTYNTLYQPTSKVDRAGRHFTYSYQKSLPVAVKDGSGTSQATLSNPNNWAYDSNTLAMTQMRSYIASTTTSTDGRGNTWKYQDDSNGHLTQIVAPDGATTTYTYDANNMMPLSVKDADNHTTTYTYDSMGNRLSMTDALGHTTTYSYEPVFNMMTSMTDPRGRTTTWAYDGHGNRIQETDPVGQTKTWTYDSHGNILTDTDKNGHTTHYQYDASGNSIQTTDPLGNVTMMAYDGDGNLLSTTDANGHTTQYQYDGLNRVITETDATGHATTTTYDGEGNRTQVIDRNGHSTTYQYDQRQRLIRTTDALGHPETSTYDGNDNRTSRTDRNGHITTYMYDVQNRLTQVQDALGNTIKTTYDPVGNILTQTDADAHTTTNTYDALNRRVNTTDALSEQTQYQYDTGTLGSCPNCGATPGSNLVTGQTDANGKVTYYKYDALDRLIDEVRKVGSTADTITPSDAVTAYTYDAVGNRLTVTEPNGNTTTDQYDADNRRIQETNAAGDIAQTTYDGVGNVITVAAPNLNVTTYAYDSLNRLVQVTDSVGLVAKYTYDAVGNRVSQRDGNINTTHFSYDAVNRLITTTDALGKNTTDQYDSVGNLLKVTDRKGNATIYAYDSINRRTSITDALSNTTQYQYDPVGNLITLTDANGQATQYFYDAVSRPIREEYADGLSRTFTYDHVANLLTRTDQIGNVTHYSYNDLYFLLSRTYPSAVNDSFTYDLSGRMLSAQRGAWADSFSYDGANRLIQTVQNGKNISYSYNIPGRTRTITYPGGRVITEHLDARTRLDHIDDASSPPSIVQYTYDAGDRALSRSFRNGTSAAYTYNANNWTLNLQHAKGATPIAGFQYAYDNEGNKQFEKKLQDTTHSEAYQYDATYRLINYAVGRLVGSTVSIPVTQTSYSLDPVGNWKSKTTDSVPQMRVQNSTNELIKIDNQTVTYDADGNMQEDGAYTYVYDEENRLTTVTRISDSAVVGQYQYDALGRRVQKIANPAGIPATTVYFYDGARIVEEQSGGSTQATYVYGNYIDEPLTMDRGGQTYYYHQNAMWSVEAITDSAGAAVERYAYDAYGAVTVMDGSFHPITPNAWGTPHSAIGNPWMFTGRQLDEETGLYYYRARYYDPVKGRFLERDPAEYLRGANLYEYSRSNPLRLVDPSGLWDWDLATIGAIAGTVAAAAVVVVTAPVSVPIAVGAVVVGTVAGGVAAGSLATNKQEAVAIGASGGAAAAATVVAAPVVLPAVGRALLPAWLWLQQRANDFLSRGQNLLPTGRTAQQTSEAMANECQNFQHYAKPQDFMAILTDPNATQHERQIAEDILRAWGYLP